jgi:hypothetical protein
MSEAGEGPAPQWFSDPASLLAALYLHTPGARPFALSRPDGYSPGRGSRGSGLIMPLAAPVRPIALGAAFALPRPDAAMPARADLCR